MNVVAIETFTVTAVKTFKGSAFVKQFNVDRNGVPYAKIAKFNAANGGNWYVGFANSTEGGRFNSYDEAERFVRSF